MDIGFEAARALSIVAFLFYGIHCLASETMRAEFERYGLANLHTVTGWLELAGAGGLLASYWIPSLAFPAAGGLALLMALGVWTRIRIRDPLVAMVPALLFLLINVWVAMHAMRTLSPMIPGPSQPTKESARWIP